MFGALIILAVIVTIIVQYRSTRPPRAFALVGLGGWIWGRRSALRPSGTPNLDGFAAFRVRPGPNGDVRSISGYGRQRCSAGSSGR